jgi:dTDP-4-amino-4,6-dideoxygalactose transaminase
MNLALLGGPRAVTIQREFRWPVVTDADIETVNELLRAGLMSDTAYSEVSRRFEETWASYLGVRFALSRVDGTAALHSALFALGVGPGDEVIVQSYTWIASAGCILAAGAVPVFADIDPRTYTLDPADVARRITPRTRVILAVHLWGHPAEMDEICCLARERSLRVVEDAAHAHGALYKGRKIGAIGDIGCFSFQNSKAVPAGEGGLVATNSREYFERALLLAQSPGRLAVHIELPEHLRFRDTGFGGFKYRMNPLNAALGLMQTERFEEYNLARQRNLDYLTARLREIPGIQPPYTAPHVTRGGYYGYPILYREEEWHGLPIEDVIAALKAEGVPVERERYPMLHLTAMFREKNPLGNGWPWSFNRETNAIRYERGDLPVTETIQPRLMNITTSDKVSPCEDLFDQWADAFAKVLRNIGELQAARAT